MNIKPTKIYAVGKNLDILVVNQTLFRATTVCWRRIGLLFCRQTLGNGTLYFPPFRAEDYRADIHSTVYRCKAS